MVALLLGVNPLEGGESSPEALADCRTGADANERRECRIVGTVNSIQE